MKQNWEVKKLGEVCKIGDGNHSSNYPKSTEMVFEGIPFIRANNMINGKVAWRDMKFITEDKHNILKKGHLKPFDILFTNRGEIGKIAVVGNDFKKANLNSQIAWFRCYDELEYRFLFYYLLSPLMKNHYQIEKNGAALQQFTIKQINEIKIPLPPLKEQQRIVALLDEAFTAIDKAKANTEQNLKNARELFERTKSEIFNKLKGEKVLIATVCNEIFAGGDAPKDYSKEKNEKHNIPIIANAVKDNGLYGYSDKERVSLPSITIAARGSGTGHTEIRYEPFFPIVRLIVLTPNTEKITLEFLKYSVQNLDILSSGSAIPQLTVPMLKEYKFSLPPVKDQQTIVTKLDALREQTKKLEAVYEKKLQDLEELKKSVLSKAFSGEL